MIRRIERSESDIKTLSAINVDPSTQADDFFDYSRVVVRKPWGHEYLIFVNKGVAVWILYIKKGFQTSLHCHPNKKTSLVLIAGEAVCSSLNGEFKLSAGDGLRIDKGVFHCTTAKSEGGIYVMEIESPVNKRDLVRFKDAHGRAGMPYESKEHYSINLQNYNYITLEGSDAYYNTMKKFGSCSIRIARYSGPNEFRRAFRGLQADAISLLSGGINSHGGKPIATVGDTIDLEGIDRENVKASGEVELLIIKKRDTMIRLSDYIVSYLERKGLGGFFLAPGPANLHLLDAVGKSEQIRYVFLHDERNTVMALGAYSRVSGRPGVAVVAAGASAANTISGIASLWVSSVPGLIISGQAKSTETACGTGLRQVGISELDTISLVKPITKYAARVDNSEEIRYHLEKALYLATSGRPGPVWLDIPLDIQSRVIDEDELRAFAPGETLEDNDFARARLARNVARTVELLKGAKRPLIIAGHGIRLSSAEKELRTIIGKLKVPIVVSINGKDLIETGHRQFLGVFGSFGNRSANFAVQNSDLLIVIGSRLSMQEIGCKHDAFAREAKKVVVDIDPEEVKKFTISPELPIVADAKDFIAELERQLANEKLPDCSTWMGTCREWKKKYLVEARLRKSDEFVDVYHFIEKLSELAKEGDVIVADRGMGLNVVVQALTLKKCQKVITFSGLPVPGFGVSGAIGAYAADKEHNIIAVCGDGGLIAGLSDLATIVKYRIPAKIFILDNHGHSTVRKAQKAYFKNRIFGADDESGKGFPNLEKICSAFGLKTLRIKNDAELDKLMAGLFRSEGAFACFIEVSKEQEIEPRLVSAVRPDGTLVSKPLEDMFPFLNRDELKKNMMIDLLPEE